jgi:hypothetical protein
MVGRKEGNLNMGNLHKRRYLGPYRCPLCEENEESMEYILNQCSFSFSFWDLGATYLRTLIDKIQISVIFALSKWRLETFTNKIANYAVDYISRCLIAL